MHVYSFEETSLEKLEEKLDRFLEGKSSKDVFSVEYAACMDMDAFYQFIYSALVILKEDTE